jgi:dihydrodipicolinate synthase/N-acetylneuraminate lyase
LLQTLFQQLYQSWFTLLWIVKAKKLHYEYYKFFKALFLETNPIGIKAAMSYAEMINEVYRLPMCELSFENSKILKNIMIDIMVKMVGVL